MSGDDGGVATGGPPPSGPPAGPLVEGDLRIRQVRPEFWSDETLAVLPDGARLFYIGLWGMADDAGWMEWRPPRIGALLYPYRPSRKREADIIAWAGLLVADGRLRMHDCGCASIPTLPRHQRISGKQSFQYRDSHLSKHQSLSGKHQSLSDSPVTLGNVTERNGISEFEERMTALGVKG
jgi:hypothetical protein